MDHQSRSLSDTYSPSDHHIDHYNHRHQYRHQEHSHSHNHTHNYHNEYTRSESPFRHQYSRHPRNVEAPYYTPQRLSYPYPPHPSAHPHARASFDDVPPSQDSRYDYPRHQDRPDDYISDHSKDSREKGRRLSGPPLNYPQYSMRDQDHGRREDGRPESDDNYGPREIGPTRLRKHHYYHSDRIPLPRHFDEPRQERDPIDSKRSTEQQRPPSRPPPSTSSSSQSSSSYGPQKPDHANNKEDVDEGPKSSNFRFGTTMPTTIDLQSAIESCDALCKFALHYSEQAPPSGVQELSSDSILDSSERANLHMIRSMNTTMLIGLQNLSRAEKPTEDENQPSSDPHHSIQRPPQSVMDENERIQFGPGPPSNEMVHELAKAATSIFQLAIRIKAWVGMTPAERELDEEINIIRGKRCLLMDKSLAVPTVDQHGNLQKDWAVVPGANSNSKSFYERQRDLEQQRKMLQQPRIHQTLSQHHHRNPNHSRDIQIHHTKHDPSHGNTDSERSEAEDYRRYDSGFSSSTNSNAMSMDRSNGSSYALSESNLTNRSVSGITQGLQSSNISHHNDNRRSSGSISGTLINHGVKKTTPESTPHQKYRKRAKRTQPPGRCLSCDSSDTPEWRRGPDGARTLCNACGLHYAKLLKRQNEQKQQSIVIPPNNTRTEDGPPPRGEQLQIITFQLRRQQRGESSESTTGGGSHVGHMSQQQQQDSGALVVRRSSQPSVSSDNSPMTSQREPFSGQELVQDGDVRMA